MQQAPPTAGALPCEESLADLAKDLTMDGGATEQKPCACAQGTWHAHAWPSRQDHVHTCMMQLVYCDAIVMRGHMMITPGTKCAGRGMATCMYSSKVSPWLPNARRELCARQYNSSSELQSKHPLYALWVMQDAWKRSGISRKEINIILLNSNRFLVNEKYKDMQKFCRRFELEKPKMVNGVWRS